jgi:hypothetical protein
MLKFRSPLKVETAFNSASKSSYDSVDSAYIGTFTANLSPNNPKFQSLERIINYLSEMPDIFLDNNESIETLSSEYQDHFRTLTDLTLQVLSVYKDPIFSRVLKSYGWMGTRYQINGGVFDRSKFLQALSNIYLKFQYRNPISLDAMESLDDSNALIQHDDDAAIGINHLEKIASFCPDIVVQCLEENPFILSSQANEIVPFCYTFVGSCMLVDISGFSKFSAAMCSKGVKGLDDLRNVTNGLLGQFVKSVYEHEGDGKFLLILCFYLFF